MSDEIPRPGQRYLVRLFDPDTQSMLVVANAYIRGVQLNQGPHTKGPALEFTLAGSSIIRKERGDYFADPFIDYTNDEEDVTTKDTTHHEPYFVRANASELIRYLRSNDMSLRIKQNKGTSVLTTTKAYTAEVVHTSQGHEGEVFVLRHDDDYLLAARTATIMANAKLHRMKERVAKGLPETAPPVERIIMAKADEENIFEAHDKKRRESKTTAIASAERIAERLRALGLTEKLHLEGGWRIDESVDDGAPYRCDVHTQGNTGGLTQREEDD